MRLAPLVVLALAGVAVPCAARPVRVVDDGSVGPSIPATDGRSVAWSLGTPDRDVRVLDPRTGRRRTVPTPRGCTFATVGAGSLLWNCPSGFGSAGRTLDLASGTAGALAQITPGPLSGADFAQYTGLGRFWAVVTFSGYKTRFGGFVARATGATGRESRAAR